jgi:hypothetical protein
VNGREEQWSLDKLIAEAQKGAAAQEKFQQAAETRKEAAKALSLQEDLEAVIQEGDPDAFRRLGASYGIPGDRVEEMLREFEDEGDNDDPEESFQRESKQQQRQSQQALSGVDFNALSPDLQRIVLQAERDRIDTIVDAALDKDELIAYNLSRQTPEGRAAIREYVDEKIRGRLPQYGDDFGDGARILADVLPEVKRHLQALGTPGQRTQVGLGPAPGGLGTEAYPTKRPEYVPSTEGDAFEQNIAQLLAFHQGNAESGKA